MATKPKSKVSNPYGISGMSMSDFLSGAREAGYNTNKRSDLLQYADELDDGDRVNRLAREGGETTTPKKKKAKPVNSKDDSKPKEETDTPAGNLKKSKVPTPSSASEGAGLDYLRDAKGMREREKDAYMSGQTQRMLSRRRLKSNLKEAMGLARDKQEQAAKRQDERIKGLDDLSARGPDGEYLGRVILGKDGRRIGFSTSKAGRGALGGMYREGPSGAMDNPQFPETHEQMDKRDDDNTRMANRAAAFRNMFTRARGGRLTPGEVSGISGKALDQSKSFDGEPAEGGMNPIKRASLQPILDGTPSFGAEDNQSFPMINDVGLNIPSNRGVPETTSFAQDRMQKSSEDALGSYDKKKSTAAEYRKGAEQRKLNERTVVPLDEQGEKNKKIREEEEKKKRIENMKQKQSVRNIINSANNSNSFLNRYRPTNPQQ